MRAHFKCFVILVMVCFIGYIQAETFNEFVAGVRQEAIARGINPSLFDQIFAGMEPSPQQVKLSRTQPEKRLTFLEYRNSRIDRYRILLGQQAYEANRVFFNDISRQYQVDPGVVVAVWGLETSYGNFTGTFPVVRSLATLAYQGDRRDFFRNELLLALQILNEGHISPDKFKGEWAGASGQPQFLPSSWYKYAVDYNGDGHKDIWTSKEDALASIANYLHKNGWQPNQPCAVEVNLEKPLSPSLMGLRVTKPLHYWLQHGVVASSSKVNWPDQDTPASLVHPDGGPDLLVFKNFRVILSYNNSIYYGGSVCYLAEQVTE